MKTKALLLSAVIAMISLTVSAMDEPKKTGMAVVPVKGAGIYKVVYKGEGTGRVKLNIYNASGALIMSESYFGVDGFICPLNFTGLASGSYTVEIVDATGKKIEKVNYERPVVVRPAISKEKKYVHVTRMKSGSKFLLSFVSLAAADELKVRIYGNSRLLHEEKLSVNGSLAKVFSLQGDPLNYTFEVYDVNGRLKTFRF